MTALRCFSIVGTLLAALALLGCSNGRGSLGEGEGQEEPSQVTIGGSVGGLTGSGLVLQNNGADDLTLDANGSFAFATAVDPGSEYNVTVLTQPTDPVQACGVENATGTAGAANVTSVIVTCTTGSFSVGGTISGLEGDGLVLQNNGADDVAIASNGRFTFATELESGSAYEVSVATQPSDPAQTCTVANASGTVAGAPVRNVNVTCSTNTFSISGVVSGLLGSGLVLRNNGGDDVAIESDGGFTFPTALASGSAYNVTVATQPSDPSQACTVANGSGTVGNAEVIDVVVTCTTSAFTIGGRANAVAGSGLVLHNNGADPLRIDANGSFTFPTAVLSGQTYSVTVATQPSSPRQSCTVSRGSGTVVDGNVTDVAVSCITIGFSVGGVVSGLAGSGLTLQNNGEDTLAVAANGAFTFAETLSQGSTYNVTVASQPAHPTQVCTVANGSGTIGESDISNVEVSCVTSTFRIGGTVSGLDGFGLSLRLNDVETRGVNGNGSFVFNTPLPSGSTYTVTVASQPILPFQSCTVEDGTGTVEAADITTVRVTCRR